MNRKTATLVSLGISAILIAMGIWFLWGHYTSWYMPEHGGWMMGYNGMMGGGGIVMIIFWILLIAAVVFFITSAAKGTQNASDTPNKVEGPVEILKRRYARGDIDRAEYEQKLKDVSK